MQAKEKYDLKSMYQDLPRGRKFPKSKRFPYPAFLFLCSYPRLECKDTQIRREGEERKDGLRRKFNFHMEIWSGSPSKRKDRRNPLTSFHALV